MNRILALLTALLLLAGTSSSPAIASTCNQDVTDDGAWRQIRLTFPDVAQAVTGTDKITAFAVDPKDPDVVFATNLSTVLRTVDGGCDWEVVYQLPFDEGGIALGHNSVRAIRTLGVSPHDDTVILGVDTAQRTVPEILRSERGGDRGTFETVADGFVLTGGDLPVPAMPWRTAFDPHRPGVILMLARTGGFSQPGLLLRSDDFGTTWTVGATVNADGEDYLEHPTVAFDPVHRDRVWVGLRRSIERSDDGGRTTAMVDVDLAASLDFAVGPGRDGHSVIAATYYEDGYLISRDSGETWSLVESPAAPRRVTGVAVGSGPGDLLVAHSGSGGDAEQRGLLPSVMRHDAAADAWSDLTPADTPTLGYFHLTPLDGGRSVVWAGQRGLHHHPALWRYTGPLGTPAGEPGVTGPLTRVAGTDRVATAAAVSEAVAVRSTTAVLATAAGYADALAGAPLAAHLGGPVLLNPAGTLDQRVAAELDRLGAETVVLLGGTSALSPAVQRDLEARDLAVERIAGADRFATAAAVADRLPRTGVTFVAEGANPDPARGWPDALSAGAAAAATHAPVLLVTRDQLPEATAAALHEDDEVVVVGGPAAVSAAVEDALRERAGSVRRLAGPDRYATSAAAADEALATGTSARRLWVATGRSWPDGLTAAAAAGLTDSPLVLVDGQQLSGSAASRDWIGQQREGIRRLMIVGGAAAINDRVQQELRDQLGGR